MAGAEGDVDLQVEPWRYPGRALAEAVLLGVPGDGPGGHVRLLARAGRRLGQACVRLSDGGLPLDDVLLGYDVAGVDARRPVVAFGSNADASVLLSKLSREAVSPVVPLRPGHLSGAVLAASAHVSRPGYVPAAARRRRGGRLPVVVAWLDSRQLECLDATEPNYRPLTLHAREHPVQLDDNAERLDGLTLYDTRHGVLPERFSPVDQVALWQALLQEDAELLVPLQLDAGCADHDLEAALRRLGDDEASRSGVSERLQLLREEGDLAGSTDRPLTYGAMPSQWPARATAGRQPDAGRITRTAASRTGTTSATRAPAASAGR